MNERDYYLWLAANNELELPVKYKLLNYFETPYEIYNLKSETLEKCGFSNLICSRFMQSKQISIESIHEILYKENIKFSSFADNDYPEKFKNIYNPPIGIFYKGRLPDDKLPSVSIIGARCCSEYGRQITLNFSKNLSLNNVQIISGLAIGIDGHAHEGAILGKGYTCGVLGNSIDTIYPKYNYNLFEQMYETGCVISEYFVGNKFNKTHFPERNRLIAALSDIVLVVEAKVKSGTMITIDRALEQGKDVYVIPGRIGDELSEGCMRMVMQGANIALSYKDIIDKLSEHYEIFSNLTLEKDSQYTFLPNNNKVKLNKDINNCKFTLEKNEIIVYALLSLTPIHLDDIVIKSKITYPEVIDAITKLLKKQLIICISAEYYIKNNQ